MHTCIRTGILSSLAHAVFGDITDSLTLLLSFQTPLRWQRCHFEIVSDGESRLRRHCKVGVLNRAESLKENWKTTNLELHAKCTNVRGPRKWAQISVADLERFDADPDPTFQADADPDPAPNVFS